MGGAEVDQRQIDYDRGYWDGVLAMLQEPEKAQQRLETRIRQLEELEARVRSQH